MTTQTIQARVAQPDDIPELVAMITAMALESENRALDPNTLQAGVRAVFQNPALGQYWVLTDGERPVGCTLITTEWSDWNNAPYWWIQSVYVQPDYRGQGLFEQLLTTLEAHAKPAQVAELRLYVEHNNTRAIRVYERTGFDAGHYACMTKPLV